MMLHNNRGFNSMGSEDMATEIPKNYWFWSAHCRLRAPHHVTPWISVKTFFWLKVDSTHYIFVILNSGCNWEHLWDYWWLTVTMTLSCTISEIQRLIDWKSPIFPTTSHLEPSIGVTPFEFQETLKNPDGRSHSWSRWQRFHDVNFHHFHRIQQCDIHKHTHRWMEERFCYS